jgi:hypothetical protein
MDEYISKTKFEELMRKKARNNFDLYYADKSKRYHANAIGYTIAADEAHVFPASDVQPVNQWISVKDRLPDENQKCLVYRDINADLKITTGIWHSDMKEFYGLRHGTRLEDTIAWQPLPEPPEDGDTT